jgi:hypothetical protein
VKSEEFRSDIQCVGRCKCEGNEASSRPRCDVCIPHRFSRGVEAFGGEPQAAFWLTRNLKYRGDVCE